MQILFIIFFNKVVFLVKNILFTTIVQKYTWEEYRNFKVKKILEGSSVKTINYEQMQLLSIDGSTPSGLPVNYGDAYYNSTLNKIVKVLHPLCGCKTTQSHLLPEQEKSLIEVVLFLLAF